MRNQNNRGPDCCDRLDRPPEPASAMMMIHDVSKMCDKLIRERVGDNLQDSFRNLLFHLNFNDGCTQLTLARLSHFKAPTVSVTLQKMENEGYVTRQPNTADLRQTFVFITDKGKAYNNRIHDTIKDIDAEIFSGITEDEQEKLSQLLGKVISNLSEILEKQEV